MRESWRGSLALTLAVLPFFIVFSAWTASSGWAWARFLLGVLLVAYLPGRFLIARLSLAAGHLERGLLALIVGLVSSGLVGWLCMRLGLGMLWLAWPGFSLVQALVSMRQSGWPTVSARGIHVALTLVFGLVCIPFASTPVHYRNWIRLRSGGMQDFAFDDATLHLSIANELGHAIPPQVPFLPGAPLTYHYAPDFLVRLFADATQVSVLDLTLRFMPTLYLGMAVVAIFCFARAWLKRDGLALLTVSLVLLGEDLSYIPGWWLGSQHAWAAHLFRVPTTPSLYMLNPMLPALGLLFAALLALTRLMQQQETGARTRWGVVASILIAGLFVVKVFVAAQLLACLSLAALVWAVWRRDSTLLGVSGLTSVLAAPVLWGIATGGGGLFSVSFGPSGMLTQSLSRLGLARTTFGRHVIAFESAPGLDAHALWYFFAALPVFLFACFGARSLGLVLLARGSGIRASLGDPLRLMLWAFILSGPLATLFFSIRPSEFPRAYDNAVWFFVQSKFVAWIFAVEALCELTRARSDSTRRIAATVLLAVSLPSGLQYVSTAAGGMSVGGERIVSEAQLEMLAFLQDAAPPGAVVFAEPAIASSILTLTDKRAPLLHLYTDSFVSRAELLAWQRDLRGFWSSWRRGRLDRGVVDRRGAGWLVDHRSAARPSLEPVFGNEEFVVYDLRRE